MISVDEIAEMSIAPPDQNHAASRCVQKKSAKDWTGGQPM